MTKEKKEMKYLRRSFLILAAVWMTAFMAFAQGGWEETNGKFPADLAAVRAHDGVVAVFGVGTTDKMYIDFETDTGWRGWEVLDPYDQREARFKGRPVAIVNTDGRLEVFARDMSNGTVWHIWQSSAGGPWSRWEQLGGDITDDIAVGINRLDGRVEVFGRWSDGELRHIYQRTPHPRTLWSGWEGMGVVMKGRPVVARRSDSRLEVLVRGTDNRLFTKWQTSPGGAWAGPVNLFGGILTSDPAVTTNAAGGLEIFGRGSNGQVFRLSQPSAGAPWNPGWVSIGGMVPPETGIAAALNRRGQVEVFVRGMEGYIWNRQVGPVTLTGWTNLSVIPTQGTPAVAKHADGRLVLFTRKFDDWAIRRSQTGTGW